MLDQYKLEEGILEAEMREAEKINLGETSSSENYSDSESEEEADEQLEKEKEKKKVVLMKPVFVAKNQREEENHFLDEQVKIMKEQEQIQKLKE